MRVTIHVSGEQGKHNGVSCCEARLGIAEG